MLYMFELVVSYLESSKTVPIWEEVADISKVRDFPFWEVLCSVNFVEIPAFVC